MNFNNVRFLTSVFDLDNAPEHILPEIVFAGRSNVGKSSMINKLLNRKNFARISATPGKTASINYFVIDESLYFADLPGYGYAKVSEKEKNRWSSLIEAYFNSSRQITLVLLLVDVRHTPSEFDYVMRDFLDSAGLPYIIVLTKCDKLSNNQLKARLDEIRKELDCEESRLLPFSSVNGKGKEELIKILEGCCGNEDSEI